MRSNASSNWPRASPSVRCQMPSADGWIIYTCDGLFLFWPPGVSAIFRTCERTNGIGSQRGSVDGTEGPRTEDRGQR